MTFLPEHNSCPYCGVEGDEADKEVHECTECGVEGFDCCIDIDSLCPDCRDADDEEDEDDDEEMDE